MRLWISLCFLALLCPCIGLAETPTDLVEQLPAGCVNWTKGVLEAKGYCPANSASADLELPQDPFSRAHRAATENALNTLKRVRMDATRDVGHMMVDEQVGAKIRQMAETAKIVHEVQLPEGTLEVTVRVELLGGFMQLVLPGDIKQVDAIKQMPPVSGAKDDRGYTGLIVDARGVHAKPAMVPLLVDENGRQVYGSAFVSREYAVQHGMCEYVCSMEKAHLNARVAPNPLTVKGLRTLSGQSCDIVVSNADAGKLRDASANLGFLKQCRVIIVLD